MALLFKDDFFRSVQALTPAEQAACMDFIVRFQANPGQPGISLERITGARSQGVWSGRITQELRALLYKDGDSWLLLHVDHHDAAYRWATRHDVGRHPRTGALQVVQVVSSVVEKVVEKVVHRPKAPALLAGHGDDYLLSLGVPASWLPVLRKLTSEEQLLDISSDLPDDVFDRLVRLAAGQLVAPPAPVAATQPLTAAAAGSASYYVVSDPGGLAAAVAAPLDRWLAFLHPSQQAIVDLSPRGAVKVTGSAGTGKTVVAMHRARALARRGQRVLLTSFVTTLCDNLQRNLRRLCSKDELARITVSTIDKQALGLARKVDSRLQPAPPDQVRRLVTDLATRHAPAFDIGFVVAEWEAVLEAQGLTTWPEYRGAARTGRGRPLSVSDRKALWQVYSNVLATLAARHEATWSTLCRLAVDALASGQATSPFDAVVVDELQDLRPSALRLVRALVGEHPEHLLLAGDAAQQIYAGGFSLSALGIDVRGRSHILKVNYRTTEQIRRAADRVLAGAPDDLDGATDERAGTRSLLSGPPPSLAGFADRDAELADAVRWVKERRASGLAADELAVFARTSKRVTDVLDALAAQGIPAAGLDEDQTASGAVQVGTMHRAKGLEFKAVLIVDASADALPSPGLLRSAVDPQDREHALARERHLLHVAMTRARDLVRLTWTGKPCPFLAPLLESAS